MKGNAFVSKHEKVLLETVGLFTKKINECILCFKKYFIRGIYKAAWLPCYEVPAC